MAGQDDRFSEPKRESRQFQPAVETPLERREVPATLPLANAAGLANTKLVGAPRAGQSATTTDWNSLAGWSFLQGVWKSSTKIDFMQAIAKSMGAKAVHFPSVPSLDTWISGDNQFVGRTALAAQQQTNMPLDGLVIKPGGSTGGVTTLAMTSADGTPPVALTLTKSDSKSATFTGTTPVETTSTSTDGTSTGTTTTTTSTTPAPVRVVITKRNNNNTLRITSDIQTEGQWVRMFTYTATRTKYTVG